VNVLLWIVLSVLVYFSLEPLVLWLFSRDRDNRASKTIPKKTTDSHDAKEGPKRTS